MLSLSISGRGLRTAIKLSAPAITNLAPSYDFGASACPLRPRANAPIGPEGPRNLGTSRLELDCHALPLAGRGACQIFDASRTRFFEMDAGTGAIRRVASLPGRFFVGDEPHGSWLTGWYQSGLVAVRLAPAAAVRVAGPDGARAHMLSASDRAVAAVLASIPAGCRHARRTDLSATSTSLIRIYRIE